MFSSNLNASSHKSIFDGTRRYTLPNELNWVFCVSLSRFNILQYFRINSKVCVFKSFRNIVYNFAHSHTSTGFWYFDCTEKHEDEIATYSRIMYMRKWSQITHLLFLTSHIDNHNEKTKKKKRTFINRFVTLFALLCTSNDEVIITFSFRSQKYSPLLISRIYLTKSIAGYWLRLIFSIDERNKPLVHSFYLLITI